MFKSVDPHPNFSKLEEEILKFWEKEKIFEKSLAKTRKGKPFVFYEGPPTANAAPGIHHVEARSFKDLIPRFQTMRGRFVGRKAGWDTHGLPVELQIEKKLGISGKKQIETLKPTVYESIVYFNRLCRESVWEFKEEWEKLTKRMGFWIDLKNPYVTYENVYVETVWGILKKIWNKKLIYQGYKVVPYCPRCGTALSSHEVAQGYERVKDRGLTVKFEILNPKSETNSKLQIPNDKPAYLLAWTTTPWTLPGNVALAVGKDIKYSILETSASMSRGISSGQMFLSPGYYVMASDQVADLIKEGNYFTDKIRQVESKYLIGLSYKPLFNISALRNERSHRVYAADFVTTEEGTGIVHTAVMYGEDDYQLGEKVGLPKHHTVDEEGKFTDDLSTFGLTGKGVKETKTEEEIIAYLKKHNLLFKEELYEHDYPFCWRCATALLYYARNSWFIRMSGLRRKLIENNRTINWVPAYIKEGRFGEWLREVKDWAISRERYWGTPLPFWKCTRCGEVHVIGSAKELGVKDLDLHRPYVDEIELKCKKCGGKSKRVPEVLDVWFDSGAMPFAQGTGQFPADYIAEAIDQTRGWFYTLLAVATLLGKKAPYRKVICLGHVLDEKGEKMSKSKGNVISPWDVGKKFGFDVVRWYFYTVNQPGDNKVFSEKDLLILQRRVQVIFWNIYNYFVTYANASGWGYTKNSLIQTEQSKNKFDQWQNARLQELVNQVTHDLEKYDIYRATRRLEWFVTNSFSTWYLRRNRGRSDQAFFATMHRSLVTVSKLLAPFMPFLSDYIYRNLTGEQSVHLSDWPIKKLLRVHQRKLIKLMHDTRVLVDEAHAQRAKSGLKLRQPLSRLVIPRADLPEELVDILKDEVNVLEIEYGDKLELDTKITPVLQLAGLTRELMRQINQTRKEAGLKIGEFVDLAYQTKSAKIEKALQQVDKEKTYLNKISNVKAQMSKVDREKELDIEGEKIFISLKRKAKSEKE